MGEQPLGMKVVWLQRALRNLEDAATWIAQDNPPAAARLVARIKQATEQLASHPASGRLGRTAGTRELVIAGLPYIIAYRVHADQVDILRVLHTSRRWPRRLN
jgi:addiction module RelE/StbE family toxin